MAHRQRRQRASAVHNNHAQLSELDYRLDRLAKDLPSAGLALPDCLERWSQLFASPLHPLEYLEQSAESLFRRYGYRHMCVVTKPATAGCVGSITYVIPKPSKEQLETAVRRTRNQLHEQGYPVTLGAVDRALAQAFGVQRLDELGHAPNELQGVKDLQFLEQSIHMYIITYLKARSVCTLADLEYYICQQFSTADKKIESFNELSMGPLLKFDLVKANFTPPEYLVNVPEVSAVDVVEAIAEEMTRNRKVHKQGDRIDWSTVKQYMADKHGVPFEDLCVRLPRTMGPLITGLVSQWKDEAGRLRPACKDRMVRQKASLFKVLSKAQEELRVVGQRLLSMYAAAVQQQVAAGRAAAVKQAENAVRRCLNDATRVFQTQLMLQPLTIQQLQAACLSMSSHHCHSKKGHQQQGLLGPNAAVSSGMTGSTDSFFQQALALVDPSPLLDLKLSAIKQLYDNDTEQVASLLQQLVPAAVVLQLWPRAESAAANTAVATALQQLPDLSAPPAAAAGLVPAAVHAATALSGLLSAVALGSPTPLAAASSAARAVHDDLNSAEPLLTAVMLEDASATPALAVAQDAPGNGTYPFNEVHSTVSTSKSSTGDLCETLWLLLDVLHDGFKQPEVEIQQGPGELDHCDDGRWWRQSPVAAFGTTEAATQHLLHAVGAATAEQLVMQLAGHDMQDTRLVSLLASYWKHDALIQFLLHAVRVLMEYGPALGARTSDGYPEGDASTATTGQQQQDEAGRVPKSVGLPELLTAVQNLGKGVTLHGLLQLEQDLLRQLELPSFDSVQLPRGCSSLLSILAQHDELAAALSGHEDALDVGPVLYEDVMAVIKQASANLQHSARARRGLSADGVSKAVSAVLCRHFCVKNVLQLGYGPVGRLIDDAAVTGEPGAGTLEASTASAVGCWAALALTASGAADFTARATGLQATQVLSCLASAPLLADLAVWSDWDSLYGPAFGPLKQFVAGYTTAELGFQVLEMPGGRLLKLPAATIGSDLAALRAGWQTAVQQGESEVLVGLLLSRVSSQGGLAAAHDLKMLGDILGSVMTATLAGQKGGTPHSRQQPMTTLEVADKVVHAYSPAAQRLLLLVLQCLQLLPVPLAPALAQEVLLRPLAECLGQDSETVSWALLAVAVVLSDAAQHSSLSRTAAGHTGALAACPWLSDGRLALPGARQRLHVLGYRLGIAAWQDHCKGQQHIQHQFGLGRQVEHPKPQQDQQQAMHTADHEECWPSAVNEGSETSAGLAADSILLPNSMTAVQAAAQPLAEAALLLQEHTMGSSSGHAVLTTAATADTAAQLPVVQSIPKGAGMDKAAADTVCMQCQTDAEEAATAAALVLDDASADQRLTVAASATAACAASLAITEIDDPCQQLIERIRRLKGVGVVMQGEAAEAFQATQRTLGNAVEKLSKELYSKDVHFVLELVQNADDNKYSSDVPCPMLELISTAGAVTVANNEVGFSAQDVLSLSDIGESKKKGEAGYTGQKGIGFKSVFRVTHSPHILSNGFKFNYDLTAHGKLGYVTPTWQQHLQLELQQGLASSMMLQLSSKQASIEALRGGPAQDANPSTPAPVCAPEQLLGPGGNLTAMYLPLKAGCDEVGQKLSQLRPTLLLFLRKLRCLMLTDAEQQESKLMMRLHEAGNPDVLRLLVRAVRLPQHQRRRPALAAADSRTLVDTQKLVVHDEAVDQVLLGVTAAGDVLQEEESRWLLVSETFCPGEIKRLHYDIQETKVSLAFGIHEQHPSPQDVFAFLPVRRYGLNFMVQGDFVVPSSRQDVDLDDPFNQLLRSKVPGLFASSFAKFRALPPPPGEGQVFWIDWWLSCVPLPEHMHEFFANLPSEIASHLMTLLCIPTEAEDGSFGPLVLPGQALVCNNPAIRQLVSADQLARLQDKFFVHPGVPVLFHSKELRSLLGVHEFDPQEVISLIKDVAVAGELPSSNIPQLRQLLVCVFGLLFAPSSQHQPHWAGAAAAATPVSKGSAAGAVGSSIRAQRLLRELRQVPLLPVYARPGVLVAAQGGMLRTDASSESAAVSKGTSSVFLPVGFQAVEAGVGASHTTPASTPSRSRIPVTPSRPPPSPVPADHINTAAQTAAVALKACNITQEQLAGLQQATLGLAAGTNDDLTSTHGDPSSKASSQLLFVDSELLQLDDPEALGYMIRGLKELGVRELEPLDVMDGYVLPQLTEQSARLRSAAPVADTLLPGPAEGSLSKSEQQRLMQLLAFPLAAGLLDAELQKSDLTAESATTQQQQQQQQDSEDSDADNADDHMMSAGTTTSSRRRSLFSSSPAPGDGAVSNSSTSKRPQSGHKTLLSQLADVAVVVTSSGCTRLPVATSGNGTNEHGEATDASAVGVGMHLYLPKQLGNKLDLPKTFPAYPWSLVSPGYGSCCSLVSITQWSALFTALGVQQFIPIQQQTLELTWQQLLTEPQYVDWKAAAEQTSNDVRYVVQDWHWPGFMQLVADITAGTAAGDDSSIQQQQQQLKALCSVVDSMWGNMKLQGQLEAKYSIKTVSRASAGRPMRPSSAAHKGRPAPAGLSATAASWRPGNSILPSSLLLLLQQRSWMVASDGRAHKPSDLFAKLTSIQRLFKQQVLYTACDMQRDMLLRLGATADTSLEVGIRVLAGWSDSSSSSSDSSNDPGISTKLEAAEDSAAAPTAGASPPPSCGSVTSLADMSRVYEHLDNVIGTAPLPDNGFTAWEAWQQQQAQQQQLSQACSSEEPQLPRQTLLRLRACQAFSEQALIWLPDVDAVRAAAGAAAAAAAEQSQGDEDYGYGGPTAAAAIAGRRRPHSGSANANGKIGRRQQHSSAASGAAISIPDDVMYDLSTITSIQDVSMRGHFYRPEQLRFEDDAGVLELTHHSLSSKCSSSNLGSLPVLRVAGLYYKRHQQLFVDQLQRWKYEQWIPLVGLRPTFGDYLRIMEAVIAACPDQKAASESEAYTMVLKVLGAWSDAIGRGVMTQGTQDRLWQELTGASSGKLWKVFPGCDGTWTSLTDGLILPDDPTLAQLVTNVPGITFLNLPSGTYQTATASHASRLAGVATTAAAAHVGARRDQHCLEDLLTALGVRRLSELVQQGDPVVQPEQPGTARQLTVCLAAAMPLLQRHVASQLSSNGCQQLDAVVANRLKKLQVLGVDTLARVHLLPVNRSLTADLAGVVTREDGTWVVWEEPFVALVLMGQPAVAAAADQPSTDEEEWVKPPASAAAAVEVTESVAGSDQGMTAEESAQPAATTSAYDLCRDSVSDSAAAAATAANDAEESAVSDVLYVAQPDELVECCSKVAAAFGDYIVDVAAAAGCVVDTQSTVQLLDRLLMVQATGGDVSQVMRQPEYSRYPQLPASAIPWEISIPPEAEPEVSNKVEEPLGADNHQGGDVQGADAAAAGVAAAVLPVNLDLSGLLDGGFTDEESGQ